MGFRDLSKLLAIALESSVSNPQHIETNFVPFHTKSSTFSCTQSCNENKLTVMCFLLNLSLGHTRSRDHRIARLVMNLGDVRLVATTKDQSLGFIYGLPLLLFGKMHSMIGCDNIRTVM